MHESEQCRLILLRFRTCGKILGGVSDLVLHATIYALIIGEFVTLCIHRSSLLLCAEQTFFFVPVCQIWPTLVQEEDEYVGCDGMLAPEQRRFRLLLALLVGKHCSTFLISKRSSRVQHNFHYPLHPKNI